MHTSFSVKFSFSVNVSNPPKETKFSQVPQMSGGKSVKVSRKRKAEDDDLFKVDDDLLNVFVRVTK